MAINTYKSLVSQGHLFLYVSVTQIHDHLKNHDIADNFQSAYKAGHTCETALLRLYNDIVTTNGKVKVLCLFNLIYLLLLTPLIMIIYFVLLRNM